MKRQLKLAMIILSITLVSLFLFSCSKKEKLTALNGPVITGVASSSVTGTGATITWSTNVAASSQVFYKTASGSYSSTTEADVTSGVKNHSVIITGLTVSTEYFYYVSSKDSSGVASTTESDLKNFTTTNSGPTISSVSASSATTGTSASITWTTSDAATSQVFWGTTTSLEKTPTLVADTGADRKKSHAVTLASLTANTKYYYKVESINATGGTSDSDVLNFTTSVSVNTIDFKLYIDDIQLSGTGGTPFDIYTEDFNSADFSGGLNNNLAYMGSASDGSAPDITGMSSTDTTEANTGSESWEISMSAPDANSDGKGDSPNWDGIYVLASGTWRQFFSGESGVNLSGPTGTVTLSCYAKVTGVTSAKIKIGIGDDSAYTSATDIESFGTVGSKSSCKKANTTAVTINNSSWTKITVTVGTNPDLSDINGVFLWSMNMSDVQK